MTEEQARQWRPNVEVFTRYYVCSLHFSSQEFYLRGRAYKVAPGALPSDIGDRNNQHLDVDVSIDEAPEVVRYENEAVEYEDNQYNIEEDFGPDNSMDVDNSDESYSSEDNSGSLDNGGSVGGDHANGSSEASSNGGNGGSDTGSEEIDDQEEDVDPVDSENAAREMRIMSKRPKYYLGLMPEYLPILGKGKFQRV